MELLKTSAHNVRALGVRPTFTSRYSSASFYGGLVPASRATTAGVIGLSSVERYILMQRLYEPTLFELLGAWQRVS